MLVYLKFIALSFFKNRHNTSEHPIPFHKAQDLGKIPKKLDTCGELVNFFSRYSVDSVEQVDDVIDDVSEDEAKEKGSDDVTRDSLIKPSKKAKAKTNLKK